MEMNFKMDKIGLGTLMNVDMGNIYRYEKYESQYGEANVRIKKRYGDEYGGNMEMNSKMDKLSWTRK